MSEYYQDAKIIGEYEQKFYDMVTETYEMLKELDTVTSDEEFWNIFEVIEAAYLEFESTKKIYFDLLTRDGGSAEGCSLLDEFSHGIYCIDEKYDTIKDTIKEINDFRNGAAMLA